MTTFSASLTNRTVLLLQSRGSSPPVSEAKCPPRPTHLPLLHRVDSTNHPVSQEWPGGILLVFWLHMCREQERVRKNAGTSFAPSAETARSTRTRCRTLSPLVIWTSAR